MKHFLFTLLLITLAATGSAQVESTTPTTKHTVYTRPFFSNWFVQADLTATSFHADRTPASIPSAMFKDFRSRMGFAISLGKWFTPGLGLRTRFSGLWGRTVVSTDASKNASRYFTLSEQLLFNCSNLFAGNSNTRRWNFIPYLSAAVGRNVSHDTFALGLGIGLLNEWKISEKMGAHLDVSYHAFEPQFDGAVTKPAGRSLSTRDRLFTVAVGITYNLGRPGFSQAPDIEAIKVLHECEIEALNAQLADEQQENQRLHILVDSLQTHP